MQFRELLTRSPCIEKGDTIRDPKLVKDGGLLKYDRVIANPPFSLDEWGREAAENDGYKRFKYGIPPKSKGDLAFVQHMVATLNKEGMLAVVMPHGVLFRGGSEEEIRKGLIQEDLVDAVIGLPRNLFYGTDIPAAILVLRRAKQAARKKKVLFIDASRDFKEGVNQNTLRIEDIQRIAGALRRWSDVDHYARAVEIGEIESSEWNLSISRYIKTSQDLETADIAATIAKLKMLEKSRDEASENMYRLLGAFGYEL